MPKIDEAMALAGMNPMVGMSGPHHASFIVNVMNHDKDLGDDGKVLTGVSKSLDMDDNLYGIDQNGRFFAKRKYDVMERKDIIECYKVNKDCTALIEEIEKEIQIPYDIRPIHKPSYIYEALTGHALLDENQMEYDSLCEKVQLDKMTAALAGVTQGSLQRAHNMQTGKQDKEAGYIPDNDFPQGTENMSVPGMALEGYEIGPEVYLHGNFASYLTNGKLDKSKIPRKYLTYKPSYMSENLEPKFTTRVENKGNTNKISLHYSSPNEDWKRKHQVKDTKNGHEEITVEKWEQNGKDLKNLREVANTKFYVEGETMYTLDEESDKLKFKFYHGSDKKFNILKANAFNAGNRLVPKSWSCFFWNDYKLAVNWAVFVVLRQIYQENKNSSLNLTRPFGQHFQTGEDSYIFKVYLKKSEYKTYQSLARNRKAYVYTVSLSIDDIGIGNNNFQPEYTYDKDVKPDKIDTITIDDKLLEEIVTILPDKEYDKKRDWHTNKELMTPIRGNLNPFFGDMSDMFDKYAFVTRQVKQGKIKPGDDLEEIFKTYQKPVKEASLENSFMDLIGVSEEVQYKMYKKKYKNFDEFCNVMQTPEDVINWWHINKIRDAEVEGQGSSGPAIPPDQIVREIKGICFDCAMFLHMFCKRKNIPNTVMRIAVYEMRPNGDVWIMGHLVCLYKTLSGWHIGDPRTAYDENNPGMFVVPPGPFKTKEEAQEIYTKFYKNCVLYSISQDGEKHTIYKNKAYSELYNNRIIDKIDKEILSGNIKSRDTFMREYDRITPLEIKDKVYKGLINNDSKPKQIDIFDKITSGAKSFLNKINPFSENMEVLNEAKFETNTLIPFKCEIKYCHQWIDNGVPKPIKGDPTPMLILHKDNKNWRVRTELLLFKDDKVFLCKQDTINQYGNKYKIPGGGIDDPKESIESGAARECEEEARIIPKNVKYSGVCIQKVYEKTPWWHPLILHPVGIKYDGSISFVCTGVYNKDYKGFIKKMDQENTKNGHFYSWDEVKDLLSKEHKKIFKEYLESIGKPVNSNEAVESDAIFNTDQRFLYKFKNIENLVSYIQNDIKPCAKEEDIRFIWPVELIQKKKGSCMDVAVLVHYYCELNNIENLIARIGITYKNSPNVKTESSYSHIVAMYKKNNKWSIVNNVGPDRLSKNLFTGNNHANDTLELFAKTFLPCLINHLKESKPNMIVTGEIKDIANKESSEKFDSEFFNKSGLNKQNTIRGLFESVFNAFSLEDGMMALLGVKN